MHKNLKKKVHFTLQLMIQLTVQSKDAPDDTLDGAPRMHLAISIKMHKKVHLRLHVRVHLRLHLNCTCGYTCRYNQ